MDPHDPPPPLATAQLADIAYQLGGSDGLTDAAGWLVKYAVDLTGAEWAEVVETPPARGFRVLAATDEELSRALWGTRRAGEPNPPVPDKRTPTDRIVIDDLATDERWSTLTAAAPSLPLRSAVLEFLVVEGRYAAGLAVYDRRPAYFGPDRVETVRLLGQVAAPILAGLAAIEQVEQLAAALGSNRTIGAAVGVVMCTDGLDQRTAYAALVDASQRRNRKLRDLAADVLAAGRLSA